MLPGSLSPQMHCLTQVNHPCNMARLRAQGSREKRPDHLLEVMSELDYRHDRSSKRSTLRNVLAPSELTRLIERIVGQSHLKELLVTIGLCIIQGPAEVNSLLPIRGTSTGSARVMRTGPISMDLAI
jgi:hypothetical protein